MGCTWEVAVWRAYEDEHGYAIHEYWRGENVFAAMWNALRAKRAGYRCVQITWRPRQP